jgi:hypothetical protein
MTEETSNYVQSNSPRMRLERRWWFLLEEGGAILGRHRSVEVDIGKTWLRNANGHKINQFERNVLR